MPIDNTSTRSPRLSTKGGLIVHTGSTTAELSVGANSTYLIANSSASVGINWATTTAFATPNPEIISSSTATADVSDVTISNIPSTYSGLILIISGANVSSAFDERSMSIQYNGSSSSYWYASNGPTTSRDQGRNDTEIKLNWSITGASWTASVPGGTSGYVYMTIPDYASTTKNKTGHFYTIASNSPAAGHSSWKNTSAITSIKIFPTNLAPFKSGVKVTLYGTSA